MHLLVLGVLILPQATIADQVELMHLQHIVAEEIIPIIKPLLESDAAITGKGYKLIVRTTPSSLDKIRSIVKQFDIPQRMLKITLRQVERSKEQGNSVSADGAIVLGTEAKVVLGENTKSQSGGLRLRAKKYTTQDRDDILYELKTIENHATFLRLGKSVPYELQRFITAGKHTGYGHSIGHKELSSGLYVVPRIQGDFVNLEISSQRQRLSRDEPDIIESSRLQNIVQGRLNDWITLGAIQTGRKVKDRKTTSRTIETHNDGFSVQVKVELIRQ